MILLTQDFMLNDLDYQVKTLNSCVLFKEYWYKICGYIKKVSAYNFTPKDVEDLINIGSVSRFGYSCDINDRNDREYYFKRAMGLQLIYDNGNGRNSMINGNDGQYDVCRDTIEALNMLGLIPKYRSC